MSKPVVFVFARAPCYGGVKTRLAREIGTAETLRFYRNSLERTCRRLGGNNAYEVRLATTPSSFLASKGMWRAAFSRTDQGLGDLGQRMVSVLKSAGRRPAVLVGSDIPGVRVRHIFEALRLLRHHPYVLGPVEDGGYWLIGARAPNSMPPAPLRGVRWSTQYALGDTEKRLPGAAMLRDVLFDIDDGANYRRARLLKLI